MTKEDMRFIYKRSSTALEALMDRSFSFIDERQRLQGFDYCNSVNREIQDKDKKVFFVDFGLISGYRDNNEYFPKQETKYLQEALWWNYAEQKEIFLHPLVLLFLHKKYQKLKNMIILGLLLQPAWLVSYTVLTLTLYNNGTDSNAILIPISVIMLFCSAMSSVSEVLQICSAPAVYFFRLTNICQLAQIILSIGSIYPVWVNTVPEQFVKFKVCTAFGILLTYILIMRDISMNGEEIGLVVQLLNWVFWKTVRVISYLSPLLVGFTLAFVLLFENEPTVNSAFPSPLVKILVMMIGELEYNTTFYIHDNNNKGTLGWYIQTLLLICFLIAVPISCFNLLTAFALDKVKELRERAKVTRIAGRLEHIYLIETILKRLKRLIPLKRFSKYLGSRNVTTALIEDDDGNKSIVFEHIIKAEIKLGAVESRSLKLKRIESILNRLIQPVWDMHLNQDVYDKMFNLALTNLKNQ